MKKTKMVPFNYEKAKKNPESIINSGGNKPEHVYFGSDYIGVIYYDGAAGSYIKETGNNRNGEHLYHLLLEEQTEETVSYVNVYKNGEVGAAHDTLSDAILSEQLNEDEGMAIVKFTIIDGKEMNMDVVHRY